MYERAFRRPAERSALAGMFVVALAIHGSVIPQPVAAQALGRPNVIVDESVLDQLGPPPQTLPDVLLQQQPQTYRPAPRGGADAAAAAPDRLLPPPAAMPKSRLMLPQALQPAEPESAPAARPQTARVPKAAPVPRVDRAPEPAAPPPASARTSAPVPVPLLVPPKIAPPVVSVPEPPAVTPPPRPTAPPPEAAAATRALPAPAAPLPAPAEPPVAAVEMPKAPPAPPAVPKLVPPAPPETAKPEMPQAEPPAKPESAAIPPPPAVEPPPVPAAPPARSAATTTPSQRATRSVPQLADTSPRASGESDSAGAPSQLASLPPASQPEVLDDGQLYRIPFGSASSEISEAGQKHLDELAQRMKKDGAVRLQLLGYAGSTEDSASKARRTSLFRALSVRTYLMKQGIRSTRMDVRALGNLAEGGAPDRVDAVIRK